jgi:hypothetical protein
VGRKRVRDVKVLDIVSFRYSEKMGSIPLRVALHIRLLDCS